MFNKYPYTDFHELNLDWVLAKLREFDGKLTSLDTEFDDIKSEFDTVKSEVDSLLNTMQATIQAEILAFVPDYVDGVISPYLTELQGLMAEVESLRDIMSGWENLLNQMRRDFNTADDALRADYISRIETLRYEMILELALVNDRIDNMQYNLPDIDNPVRGFKTSIEQAIEDVYNAVRYFALTALQFQGANLTAQQLDDLELTALEWDLYGYQHLYGENSKQCINPLTGERATICSILADLALFASERTWTALIWDGTWDRDADTIDNLDLTAFAFDYSDDADPNP